ncbi:hypothetical protein QFZ69_001377 [Arthrobacter sp. V1I7]|uniref:hypothetical protein n=1 Tax=Arthrobacter sp. V1I7 TaxID=3042274 RepID=UPI00278AF1C3|nr:hypothetical protein [Arthrobacter sp. V1I7]MDQ0820498.1 hypothetical protein [Arthrobacter sp. V1I7]
MLWEDRSFFATNAIRNRNGGARDVLAYAASKGGYDFGQLHGILESYRTELFRESAAEMLIDRHWKSAVLAIAQFLFAAPRDETDQLDAQASPAAQARGHAGNRRLHERWLVYLDHKKRP